jgi:hypothetical protein
MGRPPAAEHARLDALQADVRDLRSDLDRLRDQVTGANGRRQLSAETKALHRHVLALQGWACPCCRRARPPPEGFEFDHFFANSQANFEHTWPLCKKCHADLTYNRRARCDVLSDFEAYQAFAQREFPKQCPLIE